MVSSNPPSCLVRSGQKPMVMQPLTAESPPVAWFFSSSRAVAPSSLAAQAAM